MVRFYFPYVELGCHKWLSWDPYSILWFDSYQYHVSKDHTAFTFNEKPIIFPVIFVKTYKHHKGYKNKKITQVLIDSYL